MCQADDQREVPVWQSPGFGGEGGDGGGDTFSILVLEVPSSVFL